VTRLYPEYGPLEGIRTTGHGPGQRGSGQTKTGLKSMLTLGLAAAVLMSLFVAFAITWNGNARLGRIDDSMAWAPPQLDCPTGFDEDGRCVLRTLAGGVHTFLLPGILAALITGIGGIVFGLGMGY